MLRVSPLTKTLVCIRCAELHPWNNSMPGCASKSPTCTTVQSLTRQGTTVTKPCRCSGSTSYSTCMGYKIYIYVYIYISSISLSRSLPFFLSYCMLLVSITTTAIYIYIYIYIHIYIYIPQQHSLLTQWPFRPKLERPSAVHQTLPNQTLELAVALLHKSRGC